MYEKSWDAIGEKVEIQLVSDSSRNRCGGKAEIYTEVPYGIDSRHYFEVISLFRRRGVPEGSSAILAQLVEHITRNDEVVGSIPTNGSTKIKGYRFMR